MEEFGEDEVSIDTAMSNELCCRLEFVSLEISWMKFADGQFTDWYISSLYCKRILSLLNQNDNRWARIGNGIKVSGEITEFNTRIADAKEHFKVSSGGVFTIYYLTYPAIQSRTSQS